MYSHSVAGEITSNIDHTSFEFGLAKMNPATSGGMMDFG
jgi:hypothetical protein